MAHFRWNFAWRLRFWLLALPAGVGFATLKAMLKLWLGVSSERSGVFSAGNGPAMRAAILGVVFDDRMMMQEFVRASTRITHTDPKAEYGALAVALAANHSMHGQYSGTEFLAELTASCRRTGANSWRS